MPENSSSSPFQGGSRLSEVPAIDPVLPAEALQALLNGLPDAVLCLDRNWYPTYANAEAIRLSRLDPASFKTHTHWELYPETVGTEVETRYRRAMATGQPERFDFFYEPFQVFVDMHVLPLATGIALFYRDLTPQRLAERKAALQATRTQQVLDADPNGIVIVDPDWRFSFANRRAKEIVNDADLVGHDIFERFPGNLEEPFHSVYRNTMADRTPREFEAFHSAPLELWLKVQVRSNDDGGIIIFFSDITRRKAAEERERDIAHRLEQVLEVTSDAVISLDREWRYTLINSKARRLIDPENRLLGQNVWEAFPGAVRSPAWDLFHRSMDEGISGHAEMYYPEPINAWLELQAEPAADGIVVFFRDISEEKTQTELLRRQHDLLSVVQEAAHVATWELDLQTGRLHFGAGSSNVLGRPLHELNRMDKLELIMLPGHAASVREKIAQIAETRETAVLEFAVQAENGAVLWLESRVLAASDTLLRGMSIDITERKLNEEKLVASETRYRVLADLNPQAIWMGDAAGQITYANQGFLNYIGLTPESLADMGWLEAFAPEDQARVREVWAASVHSGVDYDIEAHLRRAETGEYRWWHLRAAPVRDAAGKILHWLGVANDIHDSRTFAEQLQAKQLETERQRAELETIYKTSPVGLALLDPVEFRFLNLNDHEAAMLGYPKEYILGRRLSEIAPPETVPGLLDMMSHVARGNTIADRLLEGELAARPGEKRAWSVNYSPIFNEAGKVRAISTASIEITKQKKSEAALVQSEKLAAVGRLASSISHEINNPLEAITNLFYLIAMDRELPEHLKVMVHMAQSELGRVSQIATQTLRFHRQAVNPTHVTPAGLVTAVIQLYTGRLANSHIKVDARYETEEKILCFENDIRQVLNNLIANAIDAMRMGGRLIVRAHSGHDHTDPGPGRHGVRITIADTGHGMSADTMQRLFEPFFTTKDLQGTGLGLWISMGIVERHGGRLSVRSSEDPRRHGTVFTLFLPSEQVAAS